MVFKECSIDGIQLHDELGCLIAKDNCTGPSQNKVKEFLEVLALCHTVQAKYPEGQEGQASCVLYNASSPDEKALVEACKSYGTIFLGQDESHDRFDLCLNSGTFELLHVLDFDPDRKCMSVIVRAQDGKIRLLIKGAGASIIPRCIGGPVIETQKQIDDYALVGLRTMAIAVKELTESKYREFVDDMQEAGQMLFGKEEAVQELYKGMEDYLDLLGAVAVEDKLQEDVKDTLICLHKAGIKVWILTGDKKETAINISYSCGHFQQGMASIDLSDLNTSTATTSLEVAANRQRLQPNKTWSLVIDGASIEVIFACTEVSKFRDIADACLAVICCRMTPLQKAEIVKLIKQGPNAPVTAAIGDGANDASMIQEAHVGLGISGKEGLAAVRAADFAFAKFKHLQRVLLVHGHWYYCRVAILVQYYLYINVAGFTAQFYFAFFNNYSTQSLYDSLNLTLFNVIYTVTPIFVFGLFEQNISQEKLLSNPALYKNIAKNRLLSTQEFTIWFAQGLWHSIITYFFFHFLFAFELNNNSHDSLGLLCFGVAIYQSVLIVTTLKILIYARHWNWIFLASIAISFAAFVTITLLWHMLRLPPSGVINLFNGDLEIPNGFINTVPVSIEMFWVYIKVLSSPAVWMVTVLVVVLSLLPDLTIPIIRESYAKIMNPLEA